MTLRSLCLLAGSVLFVCVAAFSAPAHAVELNAAPLSAEELDELRGGFMLPSGVEAELGAVARTFSNGELILETHVSWAEDGVRSLQVYASDVLTGAGDALDQGFSLSDADGVTLLAHQADEGAFRNVLLNEANNRDLRIETQLTITLPGFTDVQQDFRASLLAFRLHDELNTAMLLGGS